MLYEFYVTGIYNKKPFFTFDGALGLHMGNDEIERHNYIVAMCDSIIPNLTRITLAFEPKVISFCEMHWLWIGEPSMKHEIIWPTNEALEQVANEVSEVMDNLHCKEKTSCEECV